MGIRIKEYIGTAISFQLEEAIYPPEKCQGCPLARDNGNGKPCGRFSANGFAVIRVTEIEDKDWEADGTNCKIITELKARGL